MKEVEILKKLASAAYREKAPEVDVVPRVLAALASEEDELYRPFAWIAGLSSAAALPVLVLGVFAFEWLTDPVLSAFWAIKWAML